MIYIININCQFLNYYMAVPVGGCIVHCICAVEAVLVRNSKTKALKTPKLTGRLRLPRATHGPLLTGPRNAQTVEMYHDIRKQGQRPDTVSDLLELWHVACRVLQHSDEHSDAEDRRSTKLQVDLSLSICISECAIEAYKSRMR